MHLQSRPTRGTIACVGYDSVAQWIRALPCGGRGRAFESPQGHHRSEGRSRSLASGSPSERPTTWGGDRAVECARLENELGVNAYVGSNPTLPATLCLLKLNVFPRRVTVRPPPACALVAIPPIRL